MNIYYIWVYSVKICDKWWASGSEHTTRVMLRAEQKMLRNVLISVLICQVWLIKRRIDSYNKMSDVISLTWLPESERGSNKRVKRREILKTKHFFFPEWDIYILQKVTNDNHHLHHDWWHQLKQMMDISTTHRLKSNVFIGC